MMITTEEFWSILLISRDSGVSTTSNEITLTSHGFKSGDKVLHTARFHL